MPFKRLLQKGDKPFCPILSFDLGLHKAVDIPAAGFFHLHGLALPALRDSQEVVILWINKKT